jgi:hypothetical protein
VCRSDEVFRVSKPRFRLPPSGLRPARTATASMSVDFPLPFSPAKNVTSATAIDSRAEMAGIEKG